MMDDLLCYSNGFLCLAGLGTVYVRTQKNNLAHCSRGLFSHILDYKSLQKIVRIDAPHRFELKNRLLDLFV